MKAKLEAKTIPALVLVDNSTGNFVPVRKNSAGAINFFEANRKLEKMQKKPKISGKEKPIAEHPEINQARVLLFKSEKQVDEAKSALTKLRTQFNKAKKPEEKSKLKKKWESARTTYWSALDKREAAKENLEALQKKHAKKPPYEIGTHVASAFGRKPRFDGKAAGLSIAVKAIPIESNAPKLAATPKNKKTSLANKPAALSAKSKPAGKPAVTQKPVVIAKKTPAQPKIKNSALKVSASPTAGKTSAPTGKSPVSPTPTANKVVATPANTKPPAPNLSKPPVAIVSPKPAITAAPGIIFDNDPAKKPDPGSSPELALVYTELKDNADGSIEVVLKTGAPIKLDPKYDKLSTSKIPGISAVRLGSGKILYFKREEEAKPAGEVPPVPVEAPPPVIAIAPQPSATSSPLSTETKPTAPLTTESPTSQAAATGNEVSDAEAAEYTKPVPGYPVEGKLPVYIWKHKTEDKFLAVKDGMRARLPLGNFISLHRQFHPEFFQKQPKAPATPVATASPLMAP